MTNFDVDRLKIYLTRLIQYVVQPELDGAWEYTVITPSTAGAVDANPGPAALAAGLPPVVGVPCWPSVIGGSSTLPVGTVVLLIFRNRSRTAPCVIAINPPATGPKPNTIQIDATASTNGINIGGGTHGAARVSDPVDGPVSGVTGTCPSGGGALTMGQLVSATVKMGSTKVKIG